MGRTSRWQGTRRVPSSTDSKMKDRLVGYSKRVLPRRGRNASERLWRGGCGEAAVASSLYWSLSSGNSSPLKTNPFDTGTARLVALRGYSQPAIDRPM
jgi:hypothetical protein